MNREVSALMHVSRPQEIKQLLLIAINSEAMGFGGWEIKTNKDSQTNTYKIYKLSREENGKKIKDYLQLHIQNTK